MTSQTASLPLVRFSLLLAACCLPLAGCGSSGPETVAIKGQVQFEGRELPENCTVFFQPTKVASGQPLRPANSKLSSDGTFTVTSFQSGDGLIPGSYRVLVEYFLPKPGGDPAREDGWVRHTYQPDDLQIEPGTRGSVEVTYTVPLDEP